MNVKKLKKILQNKLVIFIIILLFSNIILIPMINGYIGILGRCFDKQYAVTEIHNIWDCIKAVQNNKTIGVIYVIIALIFIFTTYNIIFTKKQMKVERKGISFKKRDGTHGTANFTTPQEIDILKIGDEENTQGMVLGRTLDTGEIITLPDSSQSVNRNFMIWGASGSRKVYKLYYS